MESSIIVDELAFYYGEKQILQNISLHIDQGSFITLLGPNGSGKTTLLKNLSALLTPQKGWVLLDDVKLHKIKPQELAKKIAVVPQSSQISFPFTVLETVLMGRMPHQRRFQSDSPKDLSIAEWALKLTNTWHLKDRLITELSGGEKQRVIVAQALTQEPRILLLDEPTAHLDLEHQLDLLDLLQKLNKTSRLTVISVFHDLNLAARYSSYVVLLHRGKIYAAGTPQEVLTPQIIGEVYGIEVRITSGSDGGFHIIPVGKFKPQAVKLNNLRIHVICGGGQSKTVLEKLIQEGYQVSCGVLNIGDSDWHQAKALGLKMVEEAPFTPVKPKAYAKNLELMNQSDVILVMPTPFGPGNLGNLEQAQQVSATGKKVVLVEPDSISERDFTASRATRIYQELMKNAITANSLAEIMDFLAQESASMNNKEEPNT